MWGFLFPDKPIPPSEEEVARIALEEWQKQQDERNKIHLRVAKELARKKAQEELARLAAEKAERDRLAAEQAERDRITAEKNERDRLAAEQAERDRLAAEQAEKDRLAEIARLAKESRDKERARIESMPFHPHTYAGLNPFQLYMKEQHGIDVSSHAVHSNFPTIAFSESGSMALYGDKALAKKLNLPANIKAVQAQNGVVHQIFDPYVTVPKFIGANDAAKPQQTSVLVH